MDESFFTARKEAFSVVWNGPFLKFGRQYFSGLLIDKDRYFFNQRFTNFSRSVKLGNAETF